MRVLLINRSLSKNDNTAALCGMTCGGMAAGRAETAKLGKNM